MGEHLLRTYPDKTFIVLNWEGDNALRLVGGDPGAVDGFRRWIEARAEGVAQARDAVPDATARFYSGLEFNRVLDCGGEVPCVISSIAPRVAVDYYSYSSYEAINAPRAELATTLRTALDQAYALARSARPTLERHQMIVGEFGFPREGSEFGECDVAERVALTIQAALEWGVSYAIYWQVIDNLQSPTELATGFGLYDAAGRVRLPGRVLNAFYATGSVEGRPTFEDCPLVFAGGVANAADEGSPVRVGGTLLVRGSDLWSADGGSIVHLAQAGTQFELREGAPGWSEMAGEIRFQLPSVLVADAPTLVFVTRGDGIDSNSQAFIPEAAAAGDCGNGVIDLGEDCDGGACCGTDCRIATGAVCRPSAEPACDVPESCSGEPGCPPDRHAPDTTACGGGQCVAGACVTSVCGNGVVEPGEQCDGGACCAGCRFSPAGTSCRASIDASCDPPEFCSGFGEACPSDGRFPDGVVCPGGTCRAGLCSASTCTPSCPSTGCGGGPNGCGGTCAPIHEGTACTGGTCQSGACRPAVSPGGVVDGSVAAPDISPDSILSIYGTFSPAGNSVHIRRAGGSFTTVAAGSHFWFESATQINVQIPTERVRWHRRNRRAGGRERGRRRVAGGRILRLRRGGTAMLRRGNGVHDDVRVRRGALLQKRALRHRWRRLGRVVGLRMVHHSADDRALRRPERRRTDVLPMRR